MVFSSNVFLFLFLPLFLAVYYLTPDRHRLRNWVVLIGSYVFYAWWRIDFLVLFKRSTAMNADDQYFGLLSELENLFDRKIDLVDVRSHRNPYFMAEALKLREMLYAA